MLTGEAPPHLDTALNNIAASLMHTGHNFLVGGIVNQNVWMQIAIACMKNVASPQVIVLTDTLDPAQNLRQMATRHSDIYNIKSWSEARHSSRSTLTGQPDFVALLFILSNAYITAAVSLHNLNHLIHLRVQA